MKSKAVFHRCCAAGSAAALLVSLASCNTTKGLGQDVQQAGRAIEREAVQAKY